MEKKKKQLIVTRICCIFASFCLWLYISYCENPINTYKLKDVSVQLTNTDSLVQSNLAIIPGQKYTVSFTIRGQNLEVMKTKQSDFKVVADMSLYVLKKGQNKIPVQIIHYPSNINVENAENMWVDVELDQFDEKTLNVKTKIQGSPKTGYYYYDGIASPEKVKVSGPKKYVDLVKTVVGDVNINGLSKDTKLAADLQAYDSDGKVVTNVKLQPSSVTVDVPIKRGKKVGVNLKTTGQAAAGINIKSIALEQQTVQIFGDEDILSGISSIDTEPVDLSKLTDSKKINVKLSLPDDVTVASGNTYVSVDTAVEKTIQKTFNVNINAINVDNKFNSALDTQTAKVTVSGLESSVNNIKDGDIKCTVDCTSLSEGIHSLQVSETLPQGITNVSVVPGTVNVNITKKQ